jgi:FkbM family methyltransferase
MYKDIKIILSKNKSLYRFLSKIKNHSALKLEKKYDLISSNIIKGNAIVSIENIEGEYELDLRSDILKRILLTKEYEPEIVDLIIKKINPQKDVINIGANIGLYSNLTASKINSNRKVLAIEPTSGAFDLLKKNINRNRNENKIILYKGVASDKVGDCEMHIISGMEEYSSVGSLVHDAVINNLKFKKEIVPGNTVDNLINENNLEPQLLVMDVEGAELKVVLGAKNTLQKHCPIIISELSDKLLLEQNTSSKEVISFLENLNYVVTDLEGNKPKFPFDGNILAEIR